MFFFSNNLHILIEAYIVDATLNAKMTKKKKATHAMGRIRAHLERQDSNLWVDLSHKEPNIYIQIIGMGGFVFWN